jgi:2-amino-4-hydroxy-6-hydroxymethyldihydropteridine diphosphokinase
LSASAGNDPLHTAYISLGSNIHPEENLRRAIAMLRRDCRVLALSTCYETPAIGSSGAVDEGPVFLNMAAQLATPLDAAALKSQVLAPIENSLGRVRGPDKYAPRTIDLDILVFDDLVTDAALWRRVFLAVPLADLLPDLKEIPGGRSLREAAEALRADTPVTPRSDLRFAP